MKSKPFALLVSGGLLALMLLLLWATGTPAHAAPDAVWTVCPAGPPDCDFDVIQDAVDAANAGDTITRLPQVPTRASRAALLRLATAARRSSPRSSTSARR
jgi:hypothetical protein